MAEAEVGGGQQSPKSWRLLPGGGDRNGVNMPQNAAACPSARAPWPVQSQVRAMWDEVQRPGPAWGSVTWRNLECAEPKLEGRNAIKDQQGASQKRLTRGSS